MQKGNDTRQAKHTNNRNEYKFENRKSRLSKITIESFAKKKVKCAMNVVESTLSLPCFCSADDVVVDDDDSNNG